MLDAAPSGAIPLLPGSLGALAVGMLYLACIGAALRHALESAPGSRERHFRLAVLAVLACAGAAEALRLPAQATQALRDFFMAQGWYRSRRGVQLEAVLGLCITGIVVMNSLVSLAPEGRLSKNLFRSLGALLLFILVRSVSMHEIDGMLNAPVAGRTAVHHCIEGGLLGAILVLLLRRAQRPADPGRGRLLG